MVTLALTLTLTLALTLTPTAGANPGGLHERGGPGAVPQPARARLPLGQGQ